MSHDKEKEKMDCIFATVILIVIVLLIVAAISLPPPDSIQNINKATFETAVDAIVDFGKDILLTTPETATMETASNIIIPKRAATWL